MHITFTLRNQTFPTVQSGNVDLPQKNQVKYLGMYLNRSLTVARTHTQCPQSRLHSQLLSNGFEWRRSPSSGFPNYPQPWLQNSHSNSSQGLNLSSSLTD
jgi:hypothetical protein